LGNFTKKYLGSDISGELRQKKWFRVFPENFGKKNGFGCFRKTSAIFGDDKKKLTSKQQLLPRLAPKKRGGMRVTYPAGRAKTPYAGKGMDRVSNLNTFFEHSWNFSGHCKRALN